jgi:hypothetical protein
MRALIIALFVVLILSPGLLLGFLASPWFFLFLFLLLILFPVALAPRTGSNGGQESPGLLVWAVAIAAIVLALPVLVLGIVLAPGFFLLILLVMLPLLWIALGPSS